jgi:phosphopantothenate-cysteine ligase
MKKILITGGPTNEYIDEVMKITNMSTGRLSVNLTKYFADRGYEVTLICTRSVARSGLYYEKELANNPKVKTIQIETTQQMLTALADESTNGTDYDLIVHASAVGDYKADFTFKMEDMAKEIYEVIDTNMWDDMRTDEDKINLILGVLTNPKCKVNDDTKISSYEPNLTVKLGLTPKIIANLRNWFANAKLVGFKLLENVTKEHIIEVAKKLCNKNNMDYIIANDLHDLRQGNHISYLVNKDGYADVDFHTPEDIAKQLEGILDE